jgi:chemotaxis protein CheZ
MPAQRKVFRIEQMAARATPAAAVADGALDASQHTDILAELAALRDLIAARPPGCSQAAAIAPADLEELRAETAGLRQLLDGARRELAGLQAAACGNNARQRPACELNAVATDAEHATQQILDAAEAIEDAASTLAAAFKRKQAQTLAQDIQEQVVRIFEACNFQDISGQRIAKLLATLATAVDHVSRMVEICGGTTALSESAAVAAAGTASAAGPVRQIVLLHGPSCPGDPDRASQAEIDRLFAAG